MTHFVRVLDATHDPPRMVREFSNVTMMVSDPRTGLLSLQQQNGPVTAWDVLALHTAWVVQSWLIAPALVTAPQTP